MKFPRIVAGAVAAMAVLAGVSAGLAQQVGGNTNAVAVSAMNGFAVVARGPSWRVWQQAVSWTNDFGFVEWRTNEITEMQDGVCIQSPSGVWTDAAPQINLVPDGGDDLGHPAYRPLGR